MARVFISGSSTGLGLMAGQLLVEQGHRVVPRSIDPDDVLCVYRGGGDRRYTHCTLVLVGGEEISGAISNDALATLEARIADDAPPPMAA